MKSKKKRLFLYSILSQFLDVKNIIEIKEINSGHINDTYLIIMPNYEYILQRINTNVFKSPFGMMHNILEVTKYIRKKVIYEGENPQRAVLNVVQTRHNQILVIRKKSYWRMLEYIKDSVSFDALPSQDYYYETGRAVGTFQRLMSGFPPLVLDETFAHFHDTSYRYRELLSSINKDKENRVKICLDEIEFINLFKDKLNIITNSLQRRSIPIRVTHNDTKISNILFDKCSKKALCLIDLDTVMKGSICYDYGDALRIGASTAAEDESDLSKINFNKEFFLQYTKGFLYEVKNVITINEVKLLYYGYLLMTLEVGIRFLTDYINGDVYFKILYNDHNLVRARNQLKLVRIIEENKNYIYNILVYLLGKLRYDYKYIDSLNEVIK